MSIILVLIQLISYYNQSQMNLVCNQQFMQSYQLTGNQRASFDKVILCPQVKLNACTNLDQQKLFQQVSEVIPARVEQYQYQILSLLSQIEGLHKRVLSVRDQVEGKISRKQFCYVAFNDLENYPLSSLLSDLERVLVQRKNYNINFSQRFSCLLCDAHFHQFISHENKQVILSQ